MRRTFRAYALVVSAALTVTIAAACSGGGGGHSATVSPTPTPGAPQNVSASAGNATFHLQWDAVSGATGYKVYLSTAAITTTAGITAVFVPNAPYDTTAANWQTLHARVSAVENAAQGPLSSEVTAMPSAGWIVANHSTGATVSLDWFHADDGVMTDSIPNGVLLNNALIGTSASLYGVGEVSPGVFGEIGIANGTSHTPYANVSGHTYTWLNGRVGPTERIALAENNGSGVYSIRTYAAAGGDERILSSGCSSIGNNFLNASGIVYQCSSGGYKEYVSDGLAAGTLLTQGALFFPQGLSDTRILFFDAGTFASVSQSRSSPATAAMPLPPNTLPETILGVGSARVLVQFKSGANYGIEASDHDGSNGALIIGATTTNQFATQGVTEDGSGVLVLYNGDALLVNLAIGATTPVVDECASCNPVSEAFLIAGPKVLTHVPGVGWFVADRATGANGISFSTSDGANLVGVQPGWVLLYNSSSKKLTAYSTTSATTHLLSSNAANLSVVFEPDLSVVWLDQDGTTHVAKADGSLAPALIDATPATAVGDAGLASDGRVFYTARRSATHVETMRWDSSLSAAINATGPGTEAGHYFPQ